jgi:simple sugar transport system permease protein
VISTIMLNAIATGLVSYLLSKVADSSAGSNVTNTKTIPESSQVPGFALIPGAPNKVYGFILLAMLVGFAYWFVLNKTRFGFDLRATGRSRRPPWPAVSTSAHGADRDAVRPARWPGSSACRCCSARTSLRHTFQPGLGFAGIAIALLGRNHTRRHRLRRPALVLPRAAEQRAADPGRRELGGRLHHPGRHRPGRGHRLRGRAPRRTADGAAQRG